MKKKVWIIGFLLILGLSQIFAAPCGDVNSSGDTDIIDALMTAQFSVGLNPPNFNQEAADVDNNNVINIIDALRIAQYSVGLITELACRNPTGNGDIIVAKDGSGDYTSVQAAIDSVPDNGSRWFCVYIKNGTYHEVINIPAEKTFLRLMGESASGTILSYNNNSSVGSTWGSASTFVYSNDFIAANLTFENTNSSSQAVALEPIGQRQAYFNCRITGYQDTLYCRMQTRCYFKDCFIQGRTDFIFGDGTVVFENCEIRSRTSSGGAVTAPSTLAATAYGLIFLNCRLTADSGLGSGSVYIGRPWHPSSVTADVRSNAAFLYCEMGSHVKDSCWTSMGGVSPSTERFFEYQNSGPGAKLNSSRPQLSSAEAANYTVANIVGRPDNWDPVR